MPRSSRPRVHGSGNLSEAVSHTACLLLAVGESRQGSQLVRGLCLRRRRATEHPGRAQGKERVTAYIFQLSVRSCFSGHGCTALVVYGQQYEYDLVGSSFYGILQL